MTNPSAKVYTHKKWHERLKSFII